MQQTVIAEPQTAHTPGPWEVSGADETVVITQYECDRPFVASTLAFGSTVADARDYANARLIAAAPDLLAALKLLTHTASAREFERSLGRPTVEGLRQFCEAQETARAAIERACNP